MCLIALSWRNHPHYDLVLAANRDEFHTRSTQAAHAWPNTPGVFAGRDKKAGGTWCGVTPDGRFAAVTNYREMQPVQPGQQSRGELVANYLAGDWRAGDYCESVFANKGNYAGFNLLVGDADNLFYIGNRDDRGVYGVPAGIHSLSNGVLGENWPKTVRAEQALSACIAPATIEADSLFELLSDTTPTPDGQLPETGLGILRERFLSPVFVRSPSYGTRASTVILRGTDGTLHFVERSYDANGRTTNRIEQHWPQT